MAEPVVKGLDELFLEGLPARMGLEYRLPLGVRHLMVADPEDVQIDPGGHQRHFGLFVPGGSGESMFPEHTFSHVFERP
ncbi:MAG: hypothetical protein JO015_17610 [Verrucomicrobia bacterium]|nr:hypothetical protein [Verrucomicrobiota bacterium]